MAEDATKESGDDGFKLSLSLPSLKSTINWISKSPELIMIDFFLDSEVKNPI